MPQQYEVVLGVDSSTQSTKVVAVELESGNIVGEGRAPHTGASTQDPRDWWSALKTGVHVCVTDQMRVVGIAVGGQQHGLVTLDSSGEIVRPAPLWNNIEAADDAERLNGLANFVEETGSRLVASFTIAKLAHLARTSPDELAKVASICLPHDYVTHRLTGSLTTDRSDASGTGWYSASTGKVRRDLIAIPAGADFADRVNLPVVLGPSEPAGDLTTKAALELDIPRSIPVGPGAGDNAAAALGIGATRDELVISLGTSGVAFAVSDHPTFDETGEVAGFADATGRFLPLACTINCTRVLNAYAALFNLSVLDALDLAGTVPAGAGGLLHMPFLEGERTPNLPHARGSVLGVTDSNLNRDCLVRAAVDGVAASLAYAKSSLDRLSVRMHVITLVGGGSHHPTWQQAIADATGLPVQVRGGGEHVARGAAVQIAAIVRQEPLTDLIERWRPQIVAEVRPNQGAMAGFRLDERQALIDAERMRTYLP